MSAHTFAVGSQAVHLALAIRISTEFPQKLPVFFQGPVEVGDNRAALYHFGNEVYS